ncbi:hypothetical protein NC652_021379 [Populus alba x Populus x berolinensis]|nr:hypothetical protein NC652_021379 [Populus alba x Populus x berolinensis]
MPGNMTSLARLWKHISLSSKILNSRYMVPCFWKEKHDGEIFLSMSNPRH